MSNRTLAILVALFFVGLLAVWLGATDPGARPPLVGFSPPPPVLLPPAGDEVDGITIEGDPAGRIVLRRAGPARWERREPTRGLAPATTVEDLLRRLQGLRPLRESGPLEGPASRYGLAPPRRVVRLTARDRPVATLELGAATAGTVYVRAGGGPIVPVDAGGVNLLDQPAAFWRESQLLPLTRLDARSATIRREGATLRVEGEPGGGWRLAEPVRAPAEERAVRGLIARLASLKAGEAVPAGTASGLDDPWLRVAIATPNEGDWGVAVGAEIPGRPGQYAARRDGDTEVVAVALGDLSGLLDTAQALRSRRPLVFRPDRVRALAVVEDGREHLVVREPDGAWRLERPDRAPADAKVVNDLIRTLSELEAAAVLAPGAIPDTGLDAPQATLKLWLGAAGAGEVPRPDDPGELSLAVGRRDAGRKQAYVRTGGDTSVLAVVDTFPAAVPRGELAFRDRNVQAIAPGRIARIAVEQGGQTDVIVAGERPGDYAAWRMEQPVAARVDAKAVAALDLLLSRLRASSLVDGGPGPPDPARFGLDRPVVRASWTLRPEAGGSPAPAPAGGSLRVGEAVAPGDERRYAAIDGRPGVFTIDPKALAILTAELHERTVLSYPPEAVERLTLRWPGRPAWEVERRPRPFEGVDWVTRSGAGPRGVPVADLAPLAARLALLTTERFAQYGGPHRDAFGLREPALSIEVALSGGLGSRLLRIGARGPAGARFAAAGPGDSGPVFTVPEEPWAPWLAPPEAE
jgi:hypothetical protein